MFIDTNLLTQVQSIFTDGQLFSNFISWGRTQRMRGWRKKSTHFLLWPFPSILFRRVLVLTAPHQRLCLLYSPENIILALLFPSEYDCYLHIHRKLKSWMVQALLTLRDGGAGPGSNGAGRRRSVRIRRDALCQLLQLYSDGNQIRRAQLTVYVLKLLHLQHERFTVRQRLHICVKESSSKSISTHEADVSFTWSSGLEPQQKQLNGKQLLTYQ